MKGEGVAMTMNAVCSSDIVYTRKLLRVLSYCYCNCMLVIFLSSVLTAAVLWSIMMNIICIMKVYLSFVS